MKRMMKVKNMYGALKWINDKPIVNGMSIFNSKDNCLNYIEIKDSLVREKMKDFIDVEIHHTLVTLTIKD